MKSLEHLNIDVILPHLLPDEEKNESHLFGLQWFSAIKNIKKDKSGHKINTYEWIHMTLSTINKDMTKQH